MEMDKSEEKAWEKAFKEVLAQQKPKDAEIVIKVFKKAQERQKELMKR